jgi:hypothetical protein
MTEEVGANHTKKFKIQNSFLYGIRQAKRAIC